MAGFVAFGFEVFLVVGVGGNFDGDVVHYFEAVADEADAFFGVVGEEFHFGDAEVVEDLGADAVVAGVHGEAEVEVGLEGVHALFLELVGFEFVEQADAAAFLLHVDDDAFALFFDDLEGGGELVAAVAAEGAEEVAGEAGGVDADEDGFVFFPGAFEDGEVGFGAGGVGVGADAEVAVFGGEVHFDFAVDEAFVFHPVLDEVFDGDDFEFVLLGDFEELGQAGHGAVGVHDFDEDAGGFEAGEDGEVGGGFGVAGTAEDAAGFGAEGEDVAGAGEVIGLAVGVDEVLDGFGAVVGGDAGGAAVADEVDRDGEGGFVVGGIAGDHEFEAEAVAHGFGHGHADESAAVGGHEVDDLGGDVSGGGDEVAFVFAVFVVHDDDEFAFLDVGDGFGDGVEFCFHDGR